MWLEIAAMGVGAWASWQDLKEKSIGLNVAAALLLIIILGIHVHGLAGAKALAMGLALGLTMQVIAGWQPGDTLILTALSTSFLHPLLITLATVSTSFVPALFLAREKGKGATIPYAPFLTLGAILVGGLT